MGYIQINGMSYFIPNFKLNFCEMDIQKHIDKRKTEHDKLRALSIGFNDLSEIIDLDLETFKRVKIKISSKLAQIEISIRDHEKELKLQT